MKHIHVDALSLMIFFLTSCGRQNNPYPPKVIIRSEIKDSITTNVWDIRQDRMGNIWFAASDGVYRYDARLPARAGSNGNDSTRQGRSFTKVTGELISKPFFSVLEDRKGNFWFGTYGSGVYYYDARLPDHAGPDGNDEVRQGKLLQNFTTREGLASNSARPVYKDKAGNIWFATAGGASRYDGKSFRNFTTADGMSNNDVRAIVQDKAGRIWFGTRGDINIYDARQHDSAGQGKTFTMPVGKDGKTFRNVWAMIKDKNGNIWFGADGLWRYDGSTFTQIDQVGAGVIIQDEKGNVFTSIGGPIYRYDEPTLSDKKPHVTIIKTKYEGRRNLPFGMLAANDGSIWIGSDRYSYDARLPAHAGSDGNEEVGQRKTLTPFKSAAGQK